MENEEKGERSTWLRTLHLAIRDPQSPIPNLRPFSALLYWLRFDGSVDSHMKKEPTTVEIYGENYNVRGEGDPAYLAELAQYVDARMREVAAQMSNLEPMKIAILAALNISDELFRYRKRQQHTTELWMEKTEELSEKIGKSLGEASRRTQV